MTEKRRIILVLTLLMICFITLVGYLSYFQIFVAEDIKKNSYNKRLWINEENILRGSISDRNGTVLAYSQRNDDEVKRYYKYGRLYSHIIGYSYREYGKAGLELTYNNQLLNIDKNALDEIINIVIPNRNGNNIELTIDHGTQERAYKLLSGKKGSIVTMNPSTGEIYSMVSFPNFDVNNLKEEWESISENEESPLINRATQGLYEPGSVFKIITASTIRQNKSINEEHQCEGSITIDGYTFKDSQKTPHGNINLNTALEKSCNTYFLDKSIIIGERDLRYTSERFMFNKEIPFDLPINKSIYPNINGDVELAATSIGQGKVLTTPLNILMATSAIANNGEIVKPILVKRVVSNNGDIVKIYNTETLSRAEDSNVANDIKDMMIAVVNSGTGTAANIRNVQVAGKTGTAENASGKSHAWFVGFAPADSPKIAVVVILEEEGSSGGSSAAPIARDLLIYGLNNINF